MKKLCKLKLAQLNKIELSEKELNQLLGGENCCICGCRGESSSWDNRDANIIGGVSGLIPGDGGGGFGGGAFSNGI